MNDKLLPCPACARHTRAAEPLCPFCGAPLSLVPASPSADRRPRRSRSAALALGASLGLAACDRSLAGQDSPDAAPDLAAPVAVDASHSIDAAGPRDLSSTDMPDMALPGDFMSVPIYSAPPPLLDGGK